MRRIARRSSMHWRRECRCRRASRATTSCGSTARRWISGGTRSASRTRAGGACGSASTRSRSHNGVVRLLLIGGSGFIGPHVANSLIRDGHDVTIFHRGRNAAPLGARVIVGDRRRLSDSARELRDSNVDVVIDLVLSSGAQARELMTVFHGAASRVVALSSADVYRACGVLHGSEPGGLQALPLTESSELRTKLQTYPAAQVQRLQQIFGWL